MKQILQSFKSGETTIQDLPVPDLKRGTCIN